MRIKGKCLLKFILVSIICYWTISPYPQSSSAASGNLYGFNNGLIRIDPLTGTVVQLTNLSLSGLVQGVSTFDLAGHRYFFVGDDNSSNTRLFSINTQTGNVLASPLIGIVGPIEFEGTYSQVSVPAFYGLGILIMVALWGASATFFLKRRTIC